MDDKSLEILEFPRVRDILASYTSFPVSRELAINLKPSSNAKQVSLLLRQSAEARHLISLEPDFSIGGVFDIRGDGTQVSCRVDSRRERLNSVLHAILPSGAIVEHIETTTPTLGDVFIALANRSDTD